MQKAAPGPVYNPGFRQNRKKPTFYTFGHRRQVKGYSPLEPMTSTPAIVGPGHYLSKKRPLTRYRQ